MGLSTEEYYSNWKTLLRASGLSQPLLDAIMSHIDYNEFFGLGVIVITVPPQRELSYFKDEVYWRDGDETKKAESPKQIAALAQRF